jgi:hypothetical protein
MMMVPISLLAGKPESRNAWMPKNVEFFELPSFPASQLQASKPLAPNWANIGRSIHRLQPLTLNREPLNLHLKEIQDG